MKLTILALSTLVFVSPLKAEDRCTDLISLANSIMTSRQRGMPIEKVIDIIKDTETKEEVKNATIKLIVEAYKEPRYSVKKNQDNAILDFSNRLGVICYGSK